MIGILWGRVCRPSETRFTANGKPVCTFEVEQEARDGQRWTSTYKVSLWGKTAEAARFSEGDRVVVEVTELKPEAWIGKNDGKARGKVNVSTFKVQTIAAGRQAPAEAEREQTPAEQAAEVDKPEEPPEAQPESAVNGQNALVDGDDSDRLPF